MNTSSNGPVDVPRAVAFRVLVLTYHHTAYCAFISTIVCLVCLSSHTLTTYKIMAVYRIWAISLPETPRDICSSRETAALAL